MTDLSISPDDLQAGGAAFTGHAGTLAAHANTATELAAALPAAFAGFAGLAAPIVAGLGDLASGIGAAGQQVGALGTSLGSTGAQASEVDQRNSQMISG